MTETSKRVGVFVGVGLVIAATSLGAHAASQNISVAHQRSPISEFVGSEFRAAWDRSGALIAQAAGLAFQGGPGFQGGRGRGPGGPGGPGQGGRMGPGGMPGGPGGPAMIDLPLGRLGLSAQQQDQVQAIMQSHQDEMKGLGDRAMAARNALDAAVTADTIDDNAIRSRAADAAVVDADMAVARAHVRAEVLQVLTADQRALAKQLLAEMQAARPPRPGRGGRAGQ